ncbi:hypothetical protein HJC23_010752 [Cyclotella cryptica]|uniref:Transmembrane protein n=1 Tax=Cyclotella cryptica TaxID=29204 RepID=A0ABD3PV73_9STRA|eukprot:CCRYP_011075-RA/>CCRYP_011075-RA protein AED:0.00 eAED:0.00 QI:362/1/1/1/1/1/2/1414/275
MVKFFNRGKKDVAPAPAEPTAPKSDREKILEARRRERAERKEKREQRNKKLSQSKSAEAKKKKSSQPQLTREERDARDSKLGCCYHFSKFLAGAMHFVDFVLGILSLTYGAVIYLGFENPATVVAVACMTYGSVLVLTSCMGVFGFSYKCCKRCGLLWSIYVAPLIITYYFFLIIYFLADGEAFFSYLEEYKEVMYLDDARLAEFTSMMPVVYSVLAGLAVAEMVRFCIVRDVRERLLRFDSASARIASSQTESTRSNLTEPLIGGFSEVESDEA